MSEFNVGGVTATVEPDFDKFTPALKRGLERAERGASFRIELFPELKRGWATKMRADLQKSSAKFSIPADLSVSKSAIAQMKKAVKAHGHCWGHVRRVPGGERTSESVEGRGPY